MKGGSEDPFATLFTGSITAKIGGSIMPIIDTAIHADVNPVIFEHSGKSNAGELGALVSIEYLRFTKLKCHFQRLQAE